MFVADLDAQLDGKPGHEINYFGGEKKWTEELKEYPVNPSGDPVHAATTALEIARQPSDSSGREGGFRECPSTKTMEKPLEPTERRLIIEMIELLPITAM
jgi:hypothetical protein